MAPPRRNRRPRTTLVVLVLASITIITLDARGGFHRISSGARSVAADAFAPVRSGGGRHHRTDRQLSGRRRSLRRPPPAERAAATAARPAQHGAGSQSYVQQSLAQLKQLSKLYNVPCACNLQPVAAEVTDYGTSNFAATIDIGVGRGDGVELGMPVVGGGGLVGQVVEASHHTATVRLITDGQSVVDAVYGPSPGSLAEIDGQGAGNPLAADLIPPNTPLTEGEQFVTSGLQGAEFPGGIPVATVTSSETGVTSSQETVTLRPTGRSPTSPLRGSAPLGAAHMTVASGVRHGGDRPVPVVVLLRPRAGHPGPRPPPRRRSIPTSWSSSRSWPAWSVDRPPARPWVSAPASWPTCSFPPPSGSRRSSGRWSASPSERPPSPSIARPGGCRRPWPLLGSAVYELTYAAIGSLLGQPQMLHVDLVRIVVLVSVVNAVLALPARRMLSWSLPAASTEGVPTSTAWPAPPDDGAGRVRTWHRRLGYWSTREPLAAPPVPRLAALPPPRALPVGAAAQDPPAADAPEPVLGRGRPPGAGHDRGPPRPAPPDHRRGGGPALLRPRPPTVGAPGAASAGRGQGRGGRRDPGGARRPDPGAHPRPLRQPARQQRR